MKEGSDNPSILSRHAVLDQANEREDSPQRPKGQKELPGRRLRLLPRKNKLVNLKNSDDSTFTRPDEAAPISDHEDGEAESDESAFGSPARSPQSSTWIGTWTGDVRFPVQTDRSRGCGYFVSYARRA
jgi:hypothetical protein